MRLILRNTLIGRKEEFRPIDDNNVRMYACGPTVYGRAHLGNARAAVVFDVLYRILKSLYPNVTYVRNITDVDDKIYNAAFERGISLEQLTEENIKFFHEDLGKLNVLPVDIEPKATHNIEDMLASIKKLVDRGNAYIADEHVYFDVSSIENYGALSRKNIDELQNGARIEVSQAKKNPMDFVLWKPVDEKFNFGWDSCFGKGRPGWHIECSVMAHKFLGEIFDIHGGGIDLLFPHHENELAQSRALTGQKNMANYWVHNGHLNIDNIKMSKSLGNCCFVNDILAKHDGETVRLALLLTQYSSPLNFSEDLLTQANNLLSKWYKALQHIEFAESECLDENVWAAMLDDMNTPKAISLLCEMVEKINKGEVKLAGIFMNTCRTLIGIMMKNPKDCFCSASTEKKDWILEQIDKRKQAKTIGDYSLADKIRLELLDDGIIIEDSKDGTTWKSKF
ncbi:cysteine--tRNA ligase [Alphaproteobacteria bacterium]|nr:cysteine--tRNA ligase [Alphaproteobacteria bacterium]